MKTTTSDNTIIELTTLKYKYYTIRLGVDSRSVRYEIGFKT